MNKEELIKYIEEHSQEIAKLEFICEFYMLALYGDKSNNIIINKLYNNLILANDKDKTDIINYFDNYYIKCLIAYLYKNQESKISFVEQEIDYQNIQSSNDEIIQELFLSLIDSFQENIKVRIINKISNFSMKLEIIRKLNLELRSKMLLQINKDIYNQTEQEIVNEITLLQDKQKILKLVSKLLTDKAKLITINHLKTLDASEQEIFQVASNLLTDEATLEIIKLLKSDDFRYILSTKLKQDKYIFASLDLITSNYNKKIIAGSLKSDEYIIQAIKLFSEPSDIIQLVLNLSKDTSKIKVFDMIPDNFSRRIIIMNIINDEIKMQLIDKIENVHDRISYGEYLSLDENKIKHIKKILEDEKLKTLHNINDNLLNIILSFNNPQNLYKFQDIINYLFKNLSNYNKENFIANLMHSPKNKNICYEILFEQLLQFFSNQNNVEKNKLRHVAKLFGNEIFEYLKEPKIIQLLTTLTNEEFTKLYQLFDNEELNMNDVYRIFNSFIQQKFNIDFKEERELFTKLLNSIEMNDYDTIHSSINKIITTPNILRIFNDEKIQLKIKKYYSISFTIPTTKEEFSNFLLNLITKITKEINAEKKEQLINILHEITDLNINLLRDKYVKESTINIQNHVSLNKQHDKESIIKKFLAPSINPENDILFIINTLTNTYIETLDPDTKELLNNPNIIAECIKFKRNPRNYQESLIPKNLLTKKYLKQFNKILNLAYEQGILFKDNEAQFLTNWTEETNVESTYSVNSRTNYYNILLELDPEYLKNELLPNKQLFDKIKTIMNNFKLANWGETFSPIIQSLDLEMNDENIGILINSFNKIVIKKDPASLKPIDLVNLVNTHSNRNSIPKVIFGLENYSYLANNPGPNSAGISKSARITRTFEIFRKMYNRSKITIPPFNIVTPIANGKSIRIVVGDIVNPINLTLGERTGACMRVGGAGETLFNFCNTNPNGFHIRFEDPDTGELISRVSGFRNGNTVFLNQLRDSLNENYSNPDIIAACKLAASQIIHLANKNNDSINNVVISSGYAMEKSGLSEYQLDVKDIKSGYNYFYSDVNNCAIVLATNNNNNYFIPVDLTSLKKEYNVTRSQPIICHQPEIIEFQLTRILMIEALLSNVSQPNYLNIEAINSAIVGEDWYIFSTKDGEIISNIIYGINEERRKIATNEMIEYMSNYSQYFKLTDVYQKNK